MRWVPPMAFGALLLPQLALAASPLPAFQKQVQPVVHFLIDSSGSMNTCDGGTVNELTDLTPAPGGGFLYNPRTDPAGLGNCDPALRSPGGTYPVDRMEALKLALSKILDADGNGVVDSADEQLLRIKMGLSQFGDADPLYRTNRQTLRPIGTPYADIWNAVKSMTATGNTPSGAALAGARALSIQNCYDNDPNTPCDLGPNQNAANGNDVAAPCRDYFVIFLTDGEPNTDSSQIPFDPIPVAKNLVQKQTQIGSESMPRVSVRTISIGFGTGDNQNGAGLVGSVARGVINCMNFWGGGAIADGNKDLDNDATTMDVDTNPNTQGTRVACTSMPNLTPAEKSYGNGYFAADAKSLRATFVKILNAIGAGSYSRSEPTIAATAATVSKTGAYATFFDVLDNVPEWHGHVRKYLFDETAATPKYVDCDDPSVTSNPPKPCWDGGDLLKARDWRTRTIYVANPTASLSFVTDLGAPASQNWVGTDASRPMTVHNLTPDLVGVTDLSNVTVTPGSTLREVSAMASLKDATHVYAPTDVVPDTSVSSAVNALSFAAGRPDSTHSDGTLRCGLASCTATTASEKLGDAFDGRAVVVGPPVGQVTDADYLTEFYQRPLAGYSGADAVKVGGTAVGPCPAGVTPCTVGGRRTVVYLAANDGAVHAFDDVTGQELWAFIPPGHLPRLGLARDQRTTYIDAAPLVRDVKFPCERAGDGSCKTAASQRPFEDGKWHTLLIYGQGTGGEFYFALDVTNPVAPAFLWEMRNPPKMGLTLAPATVAQIPTTGLPDAGQPGAAVIVSGGYKAAGGETDLQTIRPFDGQLLAAHPTAPQDLADAVTRPTGLVNGMVGAVRPVDGNLDGVIDRAYVGDREGRLWKMCDVKPNGDFQVSLFFDPALYDRSAFPGQPVTADNPTQGYADAGPRMTLRGPIYFPADATHTANGNVEVAFGSGDLLDPLSSPQSYGNFLWAAEDDPRAADTCAAPVRYSFANGGTPGSVTRTDGASSGTYQHVVPLRTTLSTAPSFFNNLLYYAEFDPNPDGDLCTDDYGSRVIALDAFAGNVPVALPFTVNGTKTNVQSIPGTIVTGLQIDPRTGTLFVQTSTGSGPPQTIQATGAATGLTLAGWHLLH